MYFNLLLYLIESENYCLNLLMCCYFCILDLQTLTQVISKCIINYPWYFILLCSAKLKPSSPSLYALLSIFQPLVITIIYSTRGRKRTGFVIISLFNATQHLLVPQIQGGKVKNIKILLIGQVRCHWDLFYCGVCCLLFRL